MAYIILIQITVIALSLIVSANCLDIEVQPDFVHPNDKDVKITCFGSNATTEVLEKTLRMRLMKLDDDDQWVEVADLRFDGSIIMNSVNATAVGRLGNFFDSNLVVTWPVAPDDIHGRYRCDAIVLTNTGDVVTEQSRDLDVKSMSSDLSLLLESLKLSEKRLVEKVKETMHSTMKSSKMYLLSSFESKFEDLKEYLDNRTADADSTKKPEEEMKTLQWPVGNITLLMPSDGCPLHPPAWSKSFMKFKAHPGDKYYPIDVPLHLADPHKKDGFIYRQFCSLPASAEHTQEWPEGTYCLLLNYECPSRFGKTAARVLFQFDEANFYMYYSQSPLSGTASSYVFHFCCRHDGSPSTPIDLPAQHPFYLYRHKGRCQEVKGMDVTQDVFMVETDDHVDYNKWNDGDTNFRPDISFQPYKEELCYYARRRL